MNSTGFGDDILSIDAKQFGIKTRPNLTFVGCKIGEIDCKENWKAILTPYGACYVMKITNNEKRFQFYVLIGYIQKSRLFPQVQKSRLFRKSKIVGFSKIHKIWGPKK